MNNEMYNVKSRAFDEAFTYNGGDLGCTYSKKASLLKVWAPTCKQVKCHVVKKGKEKVHAMKAEERGVWSLHLKGDYEGASYIYQVFFEDRMNEATDPYAKASTVNHQRTVIMDPRKTKVDLGKRNLQDLNHYCDAIIYELHVRDFSMDDYSGIHHKGKYLGLTEAGVLTGKGELSGVDYLADLGVTHIQLLPVYDFASVDEKNQFASYNWGYDPVQYNVPEGSYGSDVEDPYSRIRELKKAISHLHSKGLRVIMDVVYNHMYDQEASAFEKIVPGYYFRTDDKGQASNGSFCGNDLDSLRPMVKNFLLNSTRMWIEDYGFDGFRFDLMGILDIDTMNQIADQTLSLDANAMIYGEGWNMPTFLDDRKKATMMNHEQMPHIAYFSDIFREKIKGGTLDDRFHDGGYGLGDMDKTIDAMHLLLATVMPVNKEGDFIEAYFSEPTQTVNYVACHDNHTLWDKLSLSVGEEPEALRKLRHRFITSLVLLSQGIPFLHAGQEFFRSKGGEDNSYNASDDINMFRWKEKDGNLEHIAYFKDAIHLRKSYPEFRLSSKELIEKLTLVYAKDELIVYNMKALDENCGYSEVMALINPLLSSLVFEIEEGYRLIFNREGLADEIIQSDKVIVEALGIQVYIK